MCRLLSEHVEADHTPSLGDHEKHGQQDRVEEGLKRYEAHDHVLVGSLPQLLVAAQGDVSCHYQCMKGFKRWEG